MSDLRYARFLVWMWMLAVFTVGCDKHHDGGKAAPPSKEAAQKESPAPAKTDAAQDAPTPVAATDKPSTPPATAVQEDYDTIREKILALRGTIDSFRGRIDVRFDSTYAGAWVKSHTSGTVEYVFKGDKIFYRFDLKIETRRFGDGDEVETVEEQVLMSDGDFMYQIGVDAGQKAAIKANIDKLQTSVPSEEFFFFLNRDYRITVLPDDQFDGKDVWILRAAKYSEDEVLQLKTDTYFRKDIPLMVKTVNFDRFDNVMQVTEIRDIEINVQIDPDRFKFILTPDMKFDDQSW